ncbi:MAG: hypothetical protein ACI8TX_002703 [Hyphomicrobiaceae bacterium]|jgi:hypothetical protein
MTVPGMQSGSWLDLSIQVRTGRMKSACSRSWREALAHRGAWRNKPDDFWVLRVYQVQRLHKVGIVRDDHRAVVGVLPRIVEKFQR